MVRLAFHPRCGHGTECPFVAGRWRVSFEVKRVSVYFDYVVVRKDRAGIEFWFSDVITPPTSHGEERVVKAVVTR